MPLSSLVQAPPAAEELAGWLVIAAALAGGFLCLAKGADWLVGASSQAARRYGVSTLVIGLTLIAFGTSAPEIVVSMLAALEGKVDLSLGNVLGSNVANIGLVLGACAVVLPRVLESRLAPRDVGWLFASLGLTWFLMRDRDVTRADALLLLSAFVAYNVHLMLTGREEVEASESVREGHFARPKLWILVGLVSIAVGAKLVVYGAEQGAYRVGIPKSVVGLTIVAIGTSLPELAAGLGAAIKGESDISLGNVVGSNVFNLIAVIGLVALVHPFVPGVTAGEAPDEIAAAFQQALDEDLWVVLAFSLAAVLLPRLGGARFGRTKGLLLLAAYAAYSAWLYASRSL